MKSGLVWVSFLCIICLYMKLPGGPVGPDPPEGAGGTGGHLGGGVSVWSSLDGQDEAIDMAMSWQMSRPLGSTKKKKAFEADAAPADVRTLVRP